MNEIFWSQKARKQLLKISIKEAKIIFAKVAELANFPSCNNVKKLSQHRHDFRIRIGQYRVLFNHDKQS